MGYANEKREENFTMGTKQLPQMIQARLSNLSSDEGKFTSAKFSYEEALKKSGFSNSLSFSPPSNFPTQKRKRS